MFFKAGDTVKWRYPRNSSEDTALGFVVSVSAERCVVFWYDTGNAYPIYIQSLKLVQ